MKRASGIRVGVVVPPDNHVAEVEAFEGLSDVCTVHVARFPPDRGHPMRARLASYNGHLGTVLGSLAGLRPACVLVACTGSSYLLGPEEDDALYRRLSEETGCPVLGSCACIRAGLDGLGAGCISLVSPYERWLTDLSIAYWEASGIEVVSTHEVGDGRHPYAIDEADVEQMLRDVVGRTGPARAVLVTGTGVGTLEAIERVRPQSPVPVVSSMRCGIDWARSVVAAGRAGGG